MAVRKGKDTVAWVAEYKGAGTPVKAKKPIYQTNFQESTDVSTIEEETKDGVITGTSSIKYTWSLEQIVDSDDEAYILMRNLFKTRKKIVIWVVDLGSKDSTGNYKVEQVIASISKFDTEADVGSFVKLSAEFVVDGEPVSGKEILTIEEDSAVGEYISLKTALEQGEGGGQ